MTKRNNGKSPPRGLDDGRLRRIVQFIDANLQNDIRLKDLARVANLSPFHFSRAFRKATGGPPHRFVRDRRLERARELLKDSSTPLAEIALICSFSSQSSFNRAFTRAYGVSPGKFRNRTTKRDTRENRSDTEGGEQER